MHQKERPCQQSRAPLQPKVGPQIRDQWQANCTADAEVRNIIGAGHAWGVCVRQRVQGYASQAGGLERLRAGTWHAIVARSRVVSEAKPSLEVWLEYGSRVLRQMRALAPSHPHPTPDSAHDVKNQEHGSQS